MKFDLCCDVSCNDGNACTSDSCSGGACAYSAIPGCGSSNVPSGGSNYVPPSSGGDYSSPSPSAKAFEKSTPSPIPVSLQVVQLRREISENIDFIDPKDQLDIENYISQAEKMQKEGRLDQALLLMKSAKTRLNEKLAKTRSAKISFTWQLAALLLGILVTAIAYFVKTLPGKPPANAIPLSAPISDAKSKPPAAAPSAPAAPQTDNKRVLIEEFK